MSLVIEIENTVNLSRAREILGAKSNSETLELALEKVVADVETIETKGKSGDLSDEYWEDLFSDPQLPDHASGTKALLDDRNEARY